MEEETAGRVLEEVGGRADELRLGRLVLVDRRGQARIALEATDDGAAGIHLYDRDQPRAQLVLDPSGGANLKLHDRDGDVRAWLAVDAHGSPNVYLRGARDAAGTAGGHVKLAVDEYGCPILSLHDAPGRPRVLLGLGEGDGSPSLSFSDGKGDPRLLLAEDTGRGLFRLYERDDGSRGAGVPALPLRQTSTEPATDQADREAYAAAAEAARAFAAVEVRAAAERELRVVSVRLASLERSRRRERLSNLLLVLIGVVVGLGGAWLALPRGDSLGREARWAQNAGEAEPIPRSLAAEEFVLKDAGGATRARLAMLPAGWPFLQLSSQDGRTAVEVAVLPHTGARLTLRSGKSFLLMRATPGKPSSLSLFDGGETVFEAP
jgi:hypothetical protein